MKNRGNKTFIVVVIIAMILAIIILGALRSGYNGQSSNSSIQEGSSLFKVASDNKTGLVTLQGPKIDWDFYVPAFILNEEDSEYKIYNGQMVEISNTRFVYRAANYISDEADVIGDYNSYDFDKTYEVVWPKDVSGSNISWLRYRTDGNTTIVTYTISDVSCGLKLLTYDGYKGQEALLSELGIIQEQLVELTDKGQGDSGGEVNSSTEYKEYDISDLGFKISFPSEATSLKVLPEGTYKDEEGRAVIMISDKIVAVISHEANSSDIYGNIELGNDESNWVLSYMLSNPFNIGTPEYEQYNLMVESIDTAASRFNKYSS